MALVTKQIWTGAEGENQVEVVLVGGTDIFAGLTVNPAVVVKINPSAMATVAEFTADDGQYVRSLVFDGTYLYIGVDWPIG